jgi:hypothetical protein
MEKLTPDISIRRDRPQALRYLRSMGKQLRTAQEKLGSGGSTVAREMRIYEANRQQLIALSEPHPRRRTSKQ